MNMYTHNGTYNNVRMHAGPYQHVQWTWEGPTGHRMVCV